MSFDGDCEPATIWRDTKRRARKDHECSACHETIKRTQFYVEHFSLFEGEIDTLKRCMRCDKIYKHLCSISTDYPPMPKLDCGHEYKKWNGVEPPPEIAALAFALPGDIQ